MIMIKTVTLVTTIVSLCVLLLLLNYTTPVASGPLGILAIFIFIYLSLFGVVSFLIYFLSLLLKKISIIFLARKPIEPLSFKNSCLYSSVIATAPVLVIGLKSVGAIGFYEFVLILFFVSIGCLYISKKIY